MDLVFFRLINDAAGQYAWLDFFGEFLAIYGIFVIGFLLLLLWVMDRGLERHRNQYAVVMALQALVITRIILEIIRTVFPRMRPFVQENVNLLIEHSPLVSSFPSGHTMIAFSLALPVLIYNPKAGGWLVFLAFLVGLSRIYVGVHWPLDVLTSIAIALLVTFLLNYYKHIFIAPVVRFLRRYKI